MGTRVNALLGNDPCVSTWIVFFADSNLPTNSTWFAWNFLTASGFPSVSNITLFDAQSFHGGDGSGAVCGNHGGEKRTDRQRARSYAEREGVPTGDTVELRGEQASGSNG